MKLMGKDSKDQIHHYVPAYYNNNSYCCQQHSKGKIKLKQLKLAKNGYIIMSVLFMVLGACLFHTVLLSFLCLPCCSYRHCDTPFL